MKLIIELDDDIAKGIRGENDCEVEPREVVRSFQATIADAIVNAIPYDPSGDLISREALKEAITEHCRSETECLNHFWYDENIIAIIDNAPTVPLLNEQIAWKKGYECGYEKGKNDRPKGEWIKEPNGKTTDIYRCSVCKRSIMLCKGADLGNYPFCHCGADMRGSIMGGDI